MKGGEIVKSQFLRGQCVEITSRVRDAFSGSGEFGITPLMGALYANTHPNDPARYYPLRGFSSNGQDWPMEGSIGWVLCHREFTTPSEVPGMPEWGLEINVDGKTLIVTENLLRHYP